MFSLEVIYRNNCDFYIDDDSEAVLSSTLISIDEHYFSPTMARYYRQDDEEEQGQSERRISLPTRMNVCKLHFSLDLLTNW